MKAYDRDKIVYGTIAFAILSAVFIGIQNILQCMVIYFLFIFFMKGLKIIFELGRKQRYGIPVIFRKVQRLFTKGNFMYNAQDYWSLGLNLW